MFAYVLMMLTVLRLGALPSWPDSRLGILPGRLGGTILLVFATLGVGMTPLG